MEPKTVISVKYFKLFIAFRLHFILFVVLINDLSFKYLFDLIFIFSCPKCLKYESKESQFSLFLSWFAVQEFVPVNDCSGCWCHHCCLLSDITLFWHLKAKQHWMRKTLLTEIAGCLGITFLKIALLCCYLQDWGFYLSREFNWHQARIMWPACSHKTFCQWTCDPQIFQNKWLILKHNLELTGQTLLASWISENHFKGLQGIRF